MKFERLKGYQLNVAKHSIHAIDKIRLKIWHVLFHPSIPKTVCGRNEIYDYVFAV